MISPKQYRAIISITLLLSSQLWGTAGQAQQIDCSVKTCEEFNALLNAPTSVAFHSGCIAITSQVCALRFSAWPDRRTRSFDEVRFNTLRFDPGSVEFSGELRFKKVAGKELVLANIKMSPSSLLTPPAERSRLSLDSGTIDRINSEKAYVDSLRLSEQVQIGNQTDKNILLARLNLASRDLKEKELPRTFNRNKSFGPVTLEDSDLEGSKFEADVDMSNVVLKRVNLGSVTLNGSDLSRLQPPSIHSESFVLRRLTLEQFLALTKMDWQQEQINLFSEDMSSLSFKKKKMRNLDFRGKNLSASDFTDADLSGSDFRDNKGLKKAIFTNSILKGTKFCISDLNTLGQTQAAGTQAIGLLNLIDLLGAEAVGERCANDPADLKVSFFKQIRARLLALDSNNSQNLNELRLSVQRIWALGLMSRIVHGDPSYAPLTVDEKNQSNRIMRILFDHYQPTPASERKAQWGQLCSLYDRLPGDMTSSGSSARATFFAMLPLYGLGRQAEEDLKSLGTALTQEKMQQIKNALTAQTNCEQRMSPLTEAIYLRHQYVKYASASQINQDFVPHALAFGQSQTRSAVFVSEILQDPFVASALLHAIQEHLLQGMLNPGWSPTHFAQARSIVKDAWAKLAQRVVPSLDSAESGIQLTQLIHALASWDDTTEMEKGLGVQARNYLLAKSLAGPQEKRLKHLQLIAAMSVENVGSQRFLEKIADIYGWNESFYASKVFQSVVNNSFEPGFGTIPAILAQAMFLYEEQRIQSVYAGQMIDVPALNTFQENFPTLISDYPDLQQFLEPESGIVDSNPFAYWLADIRDYSQNFQTTFYNAEYLKFDAVTRNLKRELLIEKSSESGLAVQMSFGYLARIADIYTVVGEEELAKGIYLFDRSSGGEHLGLAARLLLRLQTALLNSWQHGNLTIMKSMPQSFGFELPTSIHMKIALVSASDYPFEKLMSGNFEPALTELANYAEKFVYSPPTAAPADVLPIIEAAFASADPQQDPLRLLEIKSIFKQQ